MSNKRVAPAKSLVQFANQTSGDANDTNFENVACCLNKLLMEYGAIQKETGNLQDFLRDLDPESLERTIERITSENVSPGILVATITAVNDENLTCSYGGNEITVAKPYHFRTSTFDGTTIGDITYTKITAQRRSATGTITFNFGEEIEATERQRIFPAYTVGDELTVGIIVGLTYVDLNVDGRLWVRETDVLVEGL
jgi:hypothetical protein